MFIFDTDRVIENDSNGVNFTERNFNQFFRYFFKKM